MLRAAHFGSKLGFNLLKNAVGFDATSPMDILQQLGGTYSKLAQLTCLDQPERSVFDDCVPVNKDRLDAIFLEYCLRHGINHDTAVFAASGSIGGVYKAQDPTTGEILAIKIRYPGIEDMIQKDLQAILTMTKLSDSLGGTNASPSAIQMATSLETELDYELERRTTERIGQLMATHNETYTSHDTVRVPRVHTHLCEENVLVTEYISDTTSFSKYIQKCSKPEQIRLCKALFRFVFTCGCEGLIIGDPHWGNFMVDGEGQVYAVDFGNVSTVNSNLVAEILRLVRLSREGTFQEWEHRLIEAKPILIGDDKIVLNAQDCANMYTLHCSMYDFLLEPSQVEHKTENIEAFNRQVQLGNTIKGGLSCFKSMFILLNIACYCNITCSFRGTVEGVLSEYGHRL